jgi:hypothetical protein
LALSRKRSFSAVDTLLKTARKVFDDIWPESACGVCRMMIPADENTRSLETDEAMTGKYN